MKVAIYKTYKTLNKLYNNVKSDQMENTKRIGAWKKQTAKGEVISFTIDGKKYSMWVNQFKKEDKHPDFNIVEDKPYEKQFTNKTESKDLPF